MRSKRFEILLFAAIVTIMMFLATFTPSVAQAAVNSQPVPSSWLKTGKYSVMLNDEKLYYKTDSISKTMIDDSVDMAFVHDRKILYRSGSDLCIFTLENETRNALNMIMPSYIQDDTVKVPDVQFVGFSGKYVFFFAPKKDRFLYRWDTETNIMDIVSSESEKFVDAGLLSDRDTMSSMAFGPSNNAYVKDDVVFAKQNESAFTCRPGDIATYNITTKKVSTICKNATVAFVKGKNIYFIEQKDSVILTNGIGNITIKSCSLTGKKVKTIATIKNIDCYKNMALSNKTAIYVDKNGNYKEYTFKTKKTTASTETALNQQLRNNGSLY